MSTTGSFTPNRDHWTPLPDGVSDDSEAISRTGGTTVGSLAISAAPPAAAVATDIALYRDPTSGAIKQSTAGAVRATWAGTGVTDANGNLTIAIPAGRFSATPAFAATRVGAANTSQYDIVVTASSATSVTLHVQKAVPVTVLSISVLAASVNANGETINIQAQAIG